MTELWHGHLLADAAGHWSSFLLTSNIGGNVRRGSDDSHISQKCDSGFGESSFSAETLSADRSTVITWSFNFTAGALYHNAENLLLIHDGSLASECRENWPRRQAVSTPYSGSIESGSSAEEKIRFTDAIPGNSLEQDEPWTGVGRCPYRELRPGVAMMQAAHGLGNDATKLFDWSTDRCIFSQREMRPSPVVVAGV